MITIHTVMLVALGFLLATLLALALAPAYWARAVRLTRRHISRTMPVSEAEIRADKDRLRAEYAVRIHNLESTLEKARLAAARQQVEVSRRDANISSLDAELLQLRTDLEQNVNARRVLEQTVMDRLPSVEQRLADSRALLEQRDRELASVSAETGKTVRALDEVMQINAQQRSEIERLNSVVSTRATRNRGTLRDTQFDGELALRSELEALRARTRDQENLINKLQVLVSEPAAGSDSATRTNGVDRSRAAEAELDRVRRDLSEAELALRSASEQAANGGMPGELEAQIKTLTATLGDKDATIRKLEASLAAYQEGETGGNGLKDSKIAMKARLGALQSEVDSQAETIQKLRAELAATNERAALQGAQFVEEMRRLGAGSHTQPRQAPPPKRSVAERIGEAKPALASSIKTVSRRIGEHVASAAEAMTEPTSSALNGAARDKTASATNGSANVAAAEDVAVATAVVARPDADVPQKPRLLDRLAGLSKS